MLSLSEKLLLTPYLHKQRIKVIWVEHDRVGPWLTHNPWLCKLRRLSRYATTIVVSELSKKIYEQLGFSNVIAIPNGIDASRLQPNRNQEPRTRNKTFRIGTIARLSNDKGIDLLIDAVKDLSDVQLTIVGTGPAEAALQSAICNLSHVSITPHIDDLASFYTSLDLFVLPSREHDPFGLVAGEAMMLGIPVIVTDACGIAGYLTNQRDAVIVPAGSAANLHRAIEDAHNNPGKYSAIEKEGQCTAQKLFTMEHMVERYEEILQ